MISPVDTISHGRNPEALKWFPASTLIIRSPSPPRHLRHSSDSPHSPELSAFQYAKLPFRDNRNLILKRRKICRSSLHHFLIFATSFWFFRKIPKKMHYPITIAIFFRLTSFIFRVTIKLNKRKKFAEKLRGRRKLMKNSDLKRVLLKCWSKLASFLQWVEKHPLIDRVVLLLAKLIIYFMTRG